MASTTGSLTSPTTSTVSLSKPYSDTLTLIQISGTYGTAVFKVQGSLDGTNYFDTLCVRSDTGAVVQGGTTISPTDNSTLVLRVPSDGYVAVQVKFSSLASGTAAFNIQSLAVVGEYYSISAVQNTNATTVANTITSASANALAVGPSGTSNPSFNVDGSAGSAVSGLNVVANASGSGLALQVQSSGSNEALTIDAKASAAVTIGGAASTATGLIVGSTTSAANAVLTVKSTNASALAVGRQGATNPVLLVNANTATVVTGLQIVGAASGAGCAVSVISSAGAENLTLDAKGTGTVTIAGTSTGAVTITPATTITGALTCSSTLSCTALTSTSVAATGNVACTGNITMTDAKNIVLNTSTGTKIATATTQKLGFFNATPVVQPVASSDTTTAAAGSTTTVFLNTTFTGLGGTAAYTLGGVVTSLKALGLLAV